MTENKLADCFVLKFPNHKAEPAISNTENQSCRWRRYKAQKLSLRDLPCPRDHRGISYHQAITSKQLVHQHFEIWIFFSRKAWRPGGRVAGGSQGRESLHYCPRRGHRNPKMPRILSLGRRRVIQRVTRQWGHKAGDTEQGRCTPSLALGLVGPDPRSSPQKSWDQTKKSPGSVMEHQSWDWGCN